MINKLKEREHERMVRFVKMVDCMVRSSLEHLLSEAMRGVLGSLTPFLGAEEIKPLNPLRTFLSRATFDEWEEYHANTGEGHAVVSDWQMRGADR